ncbi:pyrophosphatase PpaX [Alteribacillus iranensis]|uniref:Pyrophosphatase PpaX n=1 Tax=Alteribacillus iranensis TaxID=930128 RepID=A0A1I2EL28_9BACI|nr:pyrophosphatase PpaX [Alteribacillus iranensis]SFE93479.1 pyrophosphatase PpaX [Alteribacillus iranensis]
MTIDTVLFDLDGTLINTNELIIASFEHVLETYAPGSYNREDIIQFIGPPLDESFRKIDPDRAEEMIELYQKHNLANHTTLLEEYEGVKETVAVLHERGFRLGVVTTKRKKSAHTGLEEAGLLSYFATIITFDDVENVKPHPEPIEKAIQQTGSSPDQTIMVGDSQYDILGGKNAGVKTAGVGWSIKGEDYLRSLEPTIILDTMPDLLDFLGVRTS